MEVKEAIIERRSIRSYLDKPVSDEMIREIIECAMWAPSGVNNQPWYFLAVKGPEKMNKLKEIMDTVAARIIPNLEERFSKHPSVVKETSKFVRQLGGAPVCILVFRYRDDYKDEVGHVQLSIGAAIENMILAAQSLGLGTCWLTAPLEAEMGGPIRDFFAPDKGELVSVVSLGYPAVSPKTPARKSGRYDIV